MRKDIAETLRVFLMNGIKPNYSKIAKQFNSDVRDRVHIIGVNLKNWATP